MVDGNEVNRESNFIMHLIENFVECTVQSLNDNDLNDKLIMNMHNDCNIFKMSLCY